MISSQAVRFASRRVASATSRRAFSAASAAARNDAAGKGLTALAAVATAGFVIAQQSDREVSSFVRLP